MHSTLSTTVSKGLLFCYWCLAHWNMASNRWGSNGDNWKIQKTSVVWSSQIEAGHQKPMSIVASSNPVHPENPDENPWNESGSGGLRVANGPLWVSLPSLTLRPLNQTTPGNSKGRNASTSLLDLQLSRAFRSSSPSFSYISLRP